MVKYEVQIQIQDEITVAHIECSDMEVSQCGDVSFTDSAGRVLAAFSSDVFILGILLRDPPPASGIEEYLSVEFIDVDAGTLDPEVESPDQEEEVDLEDS